MVTVLDMGKTSGKGHKGQKARSGGGVRIGFEGGQMPLYRRVPKFGFYSRKKLLGTNQFNVVSTSMLEKLDDGTTVDLELLKSLGFGTNSKNRAGIKVLGNDKLTKKLIVKVHAVSKSAQAAIEGAGGSVEIIK